MIGAGIAKVSLVDKVDPIIELYNCSIFEMCTTYIPKS